MSTTTQWNPNNYDAQHSFVWRYGAGVLEWLAPIAGERVLDLGCGTGHLTAQIADLGAEVLGMDGSGEMVASARQMFPHLHWDRADARDFRVALPFDAVFSNAVLHWIPRADAPRVMACVSQALKPGGRFVFEMGGHGNIQAIATALNAALRAVAGQEAAEENYFPTIGEYAPFVEAAGLSVKRADLFDRPTPLQGGSSGLRDWVTTFRERAVRPLDAATREAVLRHMEDALRPTLWDGGVWTAPYVRLRMLAIKA